MIKGRQIVLRDWRVVDLHRWARWMQPGHRWKQLDGPYYPLPTDDELTQMIEQRREVIERGELPKPRTSLVIADADQNALLGTVTRYWESEETYWPGIGIAIFAPTYWGRGIGYEALGLWSDYLFQSLPQVVRLDLRTGSGNTGMMRLALKLGYCEEARFRRARIVDGAYYDGLGYGVLRDEWLARYPQGFAAHIQSM